MPVTVQEALVYKGGVDPTEFDRVYTETDILVEPESADETV